MVEKDNKHTLIILTMFALQRVANVEPWKPSGLKLE
jgi:hypothetical protein